VGGRVGQCPNLPVREASDSVPRELLRSLIAHASWFSAAPGRVLAGGVGE
jgi:hypothetical protein